MKKIALLALLFLSIAHISSANFVCVADTSDSGFLGNAAVPAKMLAAKHEYNENNMRGALIIYREILELEPSNAMALYWTARCHYALKSYDLAQDYLDRSIVQEADITNDLNFFQGQIYHRLARLDEAISAYSAYLLENEGKNNYEVYLADKFKGECEFAKDVMKKPANVNIENLGTSVNTRFDEYSPSITSNGDLLVFTSRRSTTVGNEIDQGGDYKYYEDIYYSEWDKENGSWTKAFGIEGEVNTPTYDAVLSISPSGSEIFVYKNNANSQGDIFMSTYDVHEQSWRAPEKLPRPVNTSYFESSVSITAIGEKLFFISERVGGLGQGDIYVSEKTGSGWSKPKNLGNIVNTDEDEKFVFIHPNGKTLYFASNGHQCMGSYDIFKTEYLNGQWSIPVNLGFPINTVNEESTFSLTKDNQTMLIAAEYEDSYGERDIYKVDVSEYPLISSGYDSSAYGTLLLNLQDEEGQKLKYGEVTFVLKGSNRLVSTRKADKGGLVRINLPAGQTYIAQLKSKEGVAELTIEVPLTPNKPAVIKKNLKQL